MYGTENYIQCPMINCNGKGFFKKKYIYIYIYTYFAVQQKFEISIGTLRYTG